ncbi:MAG: glycosyltransferase [Candidatus Andersenbacteria bacterium]
MKHQPPLVSVIIPVKNGARFIEEALTSVNAAVANVDHEIIVVNDGSTDDTEKILRRLPGQIRYFFQKNEGAASARNAGIKKARGEYIAFIDADDVWTKDHFTDLYNTLRDNPSAQIAMGYSQRYESTNEMIADQIPIHRHKKYGDPAFMPTFGCALFMSHQFNTVGIINPSYRLHEDVDWYLQALESDVSIAVTKNVVTCYRLHDTNTTRDIRFTDRGLLHVLARSLHRRNNKALPKLSKGTV